jgi:O-antigen ligase
LGIVVALVVAFFIGNSRTRSVLLLIAPLAAAAMVAVAPQSTLQRMTTLSDQRNGTEASESFEARRALLTKSINITLDHPLLGVGVGQFGSYEGAASDAEGRHHNNWQETHNTFTEVSSEAGIPAFICFLWGIFGALLVFYRATKITRRNPKFSEMALPIYLVTAGIVGFIGSIFFLSFGYRPYFVVLTGIALGLQQAILEPATQSAADTDPLRGSVNLRPPAPAPARTVPVPSR